MSLPSAVAQVLEENQVEYQLTDTPVFSGHFSPIAYYHSWAGATRCILMTNGQQQLQIILPANHILDLKALTEFTNETWHPVTGDALKKLIDEKSLCNLPAIPQLTGIDTLVDEAVLSHGEVVVESGANNGLIRLPANAFKQLLSKTSIANLSVAIQTGSTNDALNDQTDLSNAVASFTTLRVKQRLEDTLDFPPLPDTADRIIKLRVDPDADIKDLADIVELDPSLSAQVVSWASSPYYGAQGKIDSVETAIIRVLGFDLVMNLALGLALGKSLKLPKDAPQGFTGYWQQAVFTSATIEALVKTMEPKQRPNIGLACLGGMLHNFGYLVLAEVFPPHFSDICRHIEANPHLGHTAIERHILNVDREVLGSWLMQYWTMPEEVCIALRHQANPDYEGQHSEYANLIYVAGHLLKQQGIGDATLEPIPKPLLSRLNLSDDQLQEVTTKIVDSLDELNAMANSLG